MIDDLDRLGKFLPQFVRKSEFLCGEITDHRMQKAAIFFFPAFVVFHIFNQSFQTGFFRICTYQTVQMQSLLWILGQDRTDQLRTQKSGGTGQQNISAVLWSCFIGSLWGNGRIQVTFLFQIDSF